MQPLKCAGAETIRLLKGFPAAIKHEVEEVVNILPLNHRVFLAGSQAHDIDISLQSPTQSVTLNGEQLEIPFRIYFNEPPRGKESSLSDLQRTILNCVYSRHHDGFVRQKRLEQLIESTEPFVIPYTFQLLGEYIIEILVVLDRHVNNKTLNDYARFICDNKRYSQQIESRMISYWNEYYRHKFPDLKSYIGMNIFDKIKNHKIIP